jgi:hypothetical protein
VGQQPGHRREDDTEADPEHQSVPGHLPGEPTRLPRGAGTQCRTHQRLRGDREGVQHQRQERPQLQHDLVCADGGGGRVRRDGRRRDEARLERERPQHQVPPERQLRTHLGRLGSQRHPLDLQRPQEQPGTDHLRGDVRDRRAF